MLMLIFILSNGPCKIVINTNIYFPPITAGNTHIRQKKRIQLLFITILDIMMIEVIRRCVIRNGLI